MYHRTQSSLSFLSGTPVGRSIMCLQTLCHHESQVGQALYSNLGPTGAKKREHKCVLLAGSAASEGSNWLDIFKQQDLCTLN